MPRAEDIPVDIYLALKAMEKAAKEAAKNPNAPEPAFDAIAVAIRKAIQETPDPGKKKETAIKMSGYIKDKIKKYEKDFLHYAELAKNPEHPNQAFYHRMWNYSKQASEWLKNNFMNTAEQMLASAGYRTVRQKTDRINKNSRLARHETMGFANYSIIAPDGGSKIPAPPTNFSFEQTGEIISTFFQGNSTKFKNWRRQFENWIDRVATPQEMVKALMLQKEGKSWAEGFSKGTGSGPRKSIVEIVQVPKEVKKKLKEQYEEFAQIKGRQSIAKRTVEKALKTIENHFKSNVSITEKQIKEFSKDLGVSEDFIRSEAGRLAPLAREEAKRILGAKIALADELEKIAEADGFLHKKTIFEVAKKYNLPKDEILKLEIVRNGPKARVKGSSKSIPVKNVPGQTPGYKAPGLPSNPIDIKEENKKSITQQIQEKLKRLLPGE